MTVEERETPARTDAELLAAYASGGDDTAFAEIVERHAGRVYSACLAVLGDRHEAEDAAQAAFLVLVRKARRIPSGSALAGWLFFTAQNVARDALKRRARRARREEESAEMREADRTHPDAAQRDPSGSLYPALAALPPAQRDALVLRYLYGLSNEEAARRAGCPEGTLRSRLKTGLERLRARLSRRGVSLSAAALGTAIGGAAAAPAPAGLVSAITAACLGKTAASAGALVMAKGVFKAAAWAKIKLVAGIALAAAAGGGGGTLAVGLLGTPDAALKAETVKEIPAGARPVLITGSPWRSYLHLRKPTVPVTALKAAGKSAAAPAVLPIRKLHGGRPTPDIEQMENAAPAPAWRDVDFDDTDWPRTLGDELADPPLQAGMLCVRGRFAVSNPAAVKGLYLDVKFRGGAVIYVNGREVARSRLPAGEISAETPGDAYPEEAWVDAKGKMLHLPDKVKSADEKARIARRDRRLGPVRIPASALRKGVNVLAVELHRSDYHPVALGWWLNRNLHYGLTKSWTPVGLLDVRLAAEGAGAVPNVTRPAGLHLWNADIHERLDLARHGDPADGLRPLTLAGARGGDFSGLVVIGSDAAIKGAGASCSDLAGPGGEKIPSSAVRVRYVLDGNINHDDIYGARKLVPNALVETPPAEVPAVDRIPHWSMKNRRQKMGLPADLPPAAMLPVLVTVSVPRGAAPGDYSGTLTVSASGLKPTPVPVKLGVAGWTVPGPREMRTHVGIFQSPTTLAMHYKVKLWSEEHWKLMDRSFAMLGEVGNDLVNIPVSNQTQFGNDEGIVYWVRKPDGSYDYDFSVFDRYIALAKKHLGVPRYVALHVWHAGAWKTKPADEKNEVTVFDRKTGEREAMQVPVFGTPASEKFWTPVLHAIRKRLAAQGMEKSICLGVLSDGTAPPEVFAMFARILPEAGWTRGCHSTTFAKAPYNLKGGGKCSYHEFCYGLGLSDPRKKLPAIHAMTGPGAAWFRGEKDYRLPPFIYRTIPERGLFCETSGIGRLGLDLWSVPFETGKGKPRWRVLFNRWPHSSVAGHGDPTLVGLADAGDDGPRHSLRFELLREGLQESEALIAVSEALAKHSAKIGPKLTAECRALLVERIDVCRVTQGISEDFYAGWQDRSRRLYDLAARVAARTGSR